MAGKKGNKNALKHGIYSKFIRAVDDKELEGMKVNENKNELANARVQLSEGLERKKNAKDSDEYWKADYACRHWTEVISNMTHQNRVTGEQEVQIFESLFEAVRASNDKQAWKR